ncbi:MAG: PAS domain S-box protein [Deltaproteobacteria bacterium]|nr:PAS domain S-box protein [Deltaproteobacteria bacterium]
MSHETLMEALSAARRRIEELEHRDDPCDAVVEKGREFQSLLEVTLHSIGDAVIATDHEGRITFLNAVAKALTGWPNDDAIGEALDTVFVIRNEKTNAPVASPLTQVFAKGKVVGLANHTKLIRRDGVEIPIDDSGAPIKNDAGTILGAVLVFHDITERKRAEEALQESQARVRATFDAISDAVFLHPFVEHGFAPFIDVNDTALARYGYSRDEFLKLSAPALSAPEDAARHGSRENRKKLANARRIFEATHVTKDGETFPVEINSTVITLDGRPIILSVARDITARKALKAEQDRLRKNLGRSQKMEALGRLAGGVAHDFNNILCAIMGNATLTLDDLPRTDPLREPLEEIATAAERAANLTHQLLTFSRKQAVAPQVLDLKTTLDRIHPMLSRLIAEDITLKLVTPTEVGRIRADPSQIEQIILNLVINARDAMPRGGEILIEIGDVSPEEAHCPNPHELRADACVRLAVRDTGTGMSPEVLARIFEPFFSTKEKEKGTGLGLATVYGIVQQSDGHIEVSSVLGQGTTVEVYFPQVRDEVSVKTRQDDVPATGGKETILVVEDEDMVRTLAVRLLQRRGYDVLDAATPKDALALIEAREAPIDLLLTDVIMPGMNGYELAALLVAHQPDLKVIYTSGYTQNVIAHHGVLDEGVNFIAKPYSLDRLAKRVRDVLDAQSPQG